MSKVTAQAMAGIGSMATTYGATDEHPHPSPPHSVKRPEEKNAVKYVFNSNYRDRNSVCEILSSAKVN